MSAVAFDTLKFVQKLEAAGVQRPHAVATAEAVVESIGAADLATKSDLAAVKVELKNDLMASEHRLEKKIDGVKLEISESQISTQRFILATVVINAAVVLGAMLGLVKLLGH